MRVNLHLNDEEILALGALGEPGESVYSLSKRILLNAIKTPEPAKPERQRCPEPAAVPTSGPDLARLTQAVAVLARRQRESQAVLETLLRSHEQLASAIEKAV